METREIHKYVEINPLLNNLGKFENIVRLTKVRNDIQHTWVQPKPRFGGNF